MAPRLATNTLRRVLAQSDDIGIHYMFNITFARPGVYPQSFLLTDSSIGFMRKTNNKGVIE
jgi:hypothetical protein